MKDLLRVIENWTRDLEVFIIEPDECVLKLSSVKAETRPIWTKSNSRGDIVYLPILQFSIFWEDPFGKLWETEAAPRCHNDTCPWMLSQSLDITLTGRCYMYPEYKLLQRDVQVKRKVPYKYKLRLVHISWI